MRILSVVVLLLLATSMEGLGQTKKILTLEDAITFGLEKNYSIRISKNSSEIAKNNNTPGNAGYLPRLGLSSNLRESVVNSETDLKDGSSVKNISNGTGSLGISATLDWTLFAGFKMEMQKERLSLLQKQGETNMRMTVENTLSEIIVTYYSIVQNKDRLKVLQDAINFSNKRRELTQKKYQIGSASELAYLQSLTDLNADSAAFLRQIVTLKNAKADMNYLLVEKASRDFDVNDTIVFLNLPDYNTLISTFSAANSQVEIADQNTQIAEVNYRLTHSPKYPQVDFYSYYYANQYNYNFGTNSSFKSYNPMVGLNLSYTIFDGFNRKRNISNAYLQRETNKMQLQQVKDDIEASIYQLYNNYQTNLKLITFESENLKISRQNSFIAFEKFRLGEMSDIDLRLIQIKQLEAENRLLVAQFQAKQVETELLRISGKVLSGK